MSDSKYTKGPWKYDYFPEANYEETRLVNDSGAVILNGHGKSLELKADDAALIAAAPELFEALIQLLEELPNKGAVTELTLNEAAYAVRKARG